MASEPFKLKFSHEFDRNFGRLPKDIQKAIVGSLEDLALKPFLGKLLKGKFKGLRSLRIGDYRIIYSVNMEQRGIHIITVSHRKKIYKP